MYACAQKRPYWREKRIKSKHMRLIVVRLFLLFDILYEAQNFKNLMLANTLTSIRRQGSKLKYIFFSSIDLS